MDYHAFRYAWKGDPTRCETPRCTLRMEEHECIMGLARPEGDELRCGGRVIHISGTCAAHAPRVCRIHPWDDGRDGFCGGCLDAHQTGEHPRTRKKIWGETFQLVGPSWTNAMR